MEVTKKTTTNVMSSHSQTDSIPPRLELPTWNDLGYEMHLKLRKYFVEEAVRRKKIDSSDSEKPIDRFEARRITHILDQTALSCWGSRRLISSLYKEWIELELNPYLERRKEKADREKTVASGIEREEAKT